MLDAEGNVVCNSSPFGGTGWRYAPGQVNFSQVDYDRTRTGAALTLQYENDAKNLQMTLTGIHSRYENPWLERSANISWPTGAGFGTPVWAPFGAPAMAADHRQLQLRRRTACSIRESLASRRTWPASSRARTRRTSTMDPRCLACHS